METKPVVLLMGITGQLGSLIGELLSKQEAILLRVTTRKTEQVVQLKEKFGDAVFLDLDDPRTFPEALKGVDRLFMLTGYTVAMVVQSKALVDASQKTGVKHIVHLGVFTPEHDCYDPHFAWHQMIEVYIKASNIQYTFLHPNCFLQNFTGMYGMAKGNKLTFYSKDVKMGWIALEDVAEASAKILIEGPAKHHGKDYWFSTESLNIHEVAEAFTEATGKQFVADAKSPEQFIEDFKVDRKIIDPYFLGVEQFFIQICDGRMGYTAVVRDDMPMLIGRNGMSVKKWAELHKENLLKV